MTDEEWAQIEPFQLALDKARAAKFSAIDTSKNETARETYERNIATKPLQDAFDKAVIDLYSAEEKVFGKNVS